MFKIKFGPIIDIIEFLTIFDARYLNCVNKTFNVMMSHILTKRLKNTKYSIDKFPHISPYIMKLLSETKRIDMLRSNYIKYLLMYVRLIVSPDRSKKIPFKKLGMKGEFSYADSIKEWIYYITTHNRRKLVVPCQQLIRKEHMDIFIKFIKYNFSYVYSCIEKHLIFSSELIYYDDIEFFKKLYKEIDKYSNIHRKNIDYYEYYMICIANGAIKIANFIKQNEEYFHDFRADPHCGLYIRRHNNNRKCFKALRYYKHVDMLKHNEKLDKHLFKYIKNPATNKENEYLFKQYKFLTNSKDLMKPIRIKKMFMFNFNYANNSLMRQICGKYKNIAGIIAKILSFDFLKTSIFEDPYIICGIIINCNIKTAQRLLDSRKIKNNISCTSLDNHILGLIGNCSVGKIEMFLYSKKTYIDQDTIEKLMNVCEGDKRKMKLLRRFLE